MIYLDDDIHCALEKVAIARPSAEPIGRLAGEVHRRISKGSGALTDITKEFRRGYGKHAPQLPRADPRVTQIRDAHKVELAETKLKDAAKALKRRADMAKNKGSALNVFRAVTGW